jgi:hypothetical protein
VGRQFRKTSGWSHYFVAIRRRSGRRIPHNSAWYEKFMGQQWGRIQFPVKRSQVDIY